MKMNNVAMSLLLLAVVTSTMARFASSSSFADNDDRIIEINRDWEALMIMGSRKLVPPRLGGCIPPETQPCGLLDHCCEGLYCDGPFDGRCHRKTVCHPQGDSCNIMGYECCYPYSCYLGVCRTPPNAHDHDLSSDQA